MIRINFIEPKDDEWSDWKTRCKDATEKLIEDFENGRPISITNLYKEKKKVFFQRDDHFYGKCIYCESLIISTHPGDVEHFRPKGKVTDIKNRPIKITIDDDEVDHPGYYWLAYELTNLMPACEDCNRPSSGNSEGKKIGKWMKFPISGSYATSPGEEKNESPLLINPLIEEPNEYLKINSLGIIESVNDSPKGNMCIEVFGLNDRLSLVDERREMYKQVEKELRLAYTAISMRSVDRQEYIDKINDYKNGKRPYTLAARKAVEEGKLEHERSIREL